MLGKVFGRAVVGSGIEGVQMRMTMPWEAIWALMAVRVAYNPHQEIEGTYGTLFLSTLIFRRYPGWEVRG